MDMMPQKTPPLVWVLQRGGAALFAALLTLAIFLILPVMQTISKPPGKDLIVQDVTLLNEPPPPPPPPEVEQEEPDVEPEPPELLEQAAPLDLSQIELALNPGMGGIDGAVFAIDLPNQIGEQGGAATDQIFSLGELDQRPRVIFQRMPTYPAALRSRAGTVHVIFTVDTLGRVQDAKVERSTDVAFDSPALEAVRQWRFEPGTRGGEKVQFKMRIPITFDSKG